MFIYHKVLNMTDTVLTHDERGRNTKVSSSMRKRCWCFTQNNHTEDDVNKIVDTNFGYVMQEETGKNGTSHLQGVIKYPNAVRFSTVKKLLPKAHIEVCKNWVASIQYCSKVESRTGRMWSTVIDVDARREIGTVTLTQNEKLKLENDKLFHKDFEKWKAKMIYGDVTWSMKNTAFSKGELFMW